MIFRQSFTRELANSAGAVFTVVFAIVFTIGLVEVLNATMGGKYDTSSIFEILVYTALVNLSPLLAVSLFIAILMVMIRSWQESEMIVWFSAGCRNLLHWLTPVLILAIPISLIVGALSVSISPWAKYQIKNAATQFQHRDEVSRITPGTFIEANRGRRVFFVEEVSEDGVHVKNIFVSDKTPNKEYVVEAKTGEIKVNSLGDRYAVLHDGHRYEVSDKKETAWRVIDFKTYEMRIDVKADAFYQARDVDKISYTELRSMNNPLAKAQLVWRFSWPLATLNLALLAIPLSFTNPRAGRNMCLIIAALVFILYLNAISLGQALVKSETLTWQESLIAINGCFTLITIFLFIRRVWFLQWLPQWLTDIPYRLMGGK